MKVLIQIGHPAHVHFFKNIIWALKKDGYDVKIVARKKDVTLRILDSYGFKYEVIKYFSKSVVGKIYDLIKTDFFLYNLAKKYKPDFMMAIGLPSITHVGRVLGIPSLYFTDTEDANLANIIAKPFAVIIATPACFKKYLGPKHVIFNGFKELAYLHPNYFMPNPSVLRELGISEGERFTVLRFISWKASHDIGLRGIKKREEFIKELENYGQVFISSEGILDEKLKKFELKVPPDQLHSLLAFASLYIGEGGTTAVEAAILGTPAIHIEADSKGRATGESSGNFLELRDKYNLLYFYPDEIMALEKAKEILENKNSKAEWGLKRDKLLKDKIDVTAWMTDFIERYPESFNDYRRMNKI